MSAPTSIGVAVDRDEYSRFERERDTVLVTLDVQGTNLFGEQIQVELRKARRARDEIVKTQLITLASNVSHLVQVEFSLPDIVNEKAIPLVRRGEYFVNAFSVTDPGVEAESGDFLVSLISVDRLKADYLHGTDQFSSDQLTVVEQPQIITGVTVEEVSLGHPKAVFPLSFNYSVTHIPTVLGVTSETFALVDGQTLVLIIDGGSPQTATFNTADFVDIANATAAEVAQVINTDIPGVNASDVGGSVQIEGGIQSLFVDPAGTATTTLGLLNQSDVATVTRLLSWCNGPVVKVEAGRRLYTLRRGSGSDYIRVRVASLALLPLESRAEELLIERKPLDEERIRAIVNQAISWVEDSALAVYLEPTRVVTEVDPDTLAYPAGTDTPELVGADWDEVVDAIHYQVPASGHWINFKSPYYPLLCFEELYGKVSNTRVLDVALEWVEAHEMTGWVELVPFNQEVAFNFIGLVWVESLRGPVPLPNFWNFSAFVGYRKTPPILIELAAKKAAMDVLSIAGQAFRGGFASQSISRDGVSESVSYTASATFGIYSATIEDYRKWIDANLKELRGAFRGVNLCVV
jgi:hypothetical protein